jgi:hypothetical protein
MSVNLFSTLIDDLLIEVLIRLASPRLLKVSKAEAAIVIGNLKLENVQDVLSLAPDVWREVCRRFHMLASRPHFKARVPNFKALELEVQNAFFARCAEGFLKRMSSSRYWRDQHWVVQWGGRQIFVVSILHAQYYDTEVLHVSVSIGDDGPLGSVDFTERTDVRKKVHVPRLDFPIEPYLQRQYFQFEDPFRNAELVAVNRWIAKLRQEDRLLRDIKYTFKVAQLHRAEGKTRDVYVCYD